MATEIKCPNCNHAFTIEDAVSEEYKKELRDKMQVFKKQKEEELQKKQEEFARREQELLRQSRSREAELQEKMRAEAIKMQQSLEEKLRKNIHADFENKLLLLEQVNKENEEKLKLARQQELEFLQKMQALQIKEAELELSVQRKLQEERLKITDEIRKMEEQKNATRETEFQLRLKELEKQLEDQKKLAEEMKRRADQGSMQLQGEVQELALEKMLRTAFPFDLIEEVGKGVKGADCIQTVRNHIGQPCGRIIYESKRTKDFTHDWIEKLKTDMRNLGADVAVIVTSTMPRDMDQFGEKNGVWICTFTEVKALAHVLRDGIIKIFNSARSQENRGEKMHMLYDYLTSNEFGEQWKAIREGFQSMRLSILREREAMEKLWKAREKQLEKVLLNAAHIKGSIEGIAGNDVIRLNLLEDPDPSDLLGPDVS